MSSPMSKDCLPPRGACESHLHIPKFLPAQLPRTHWGLAARAHRRQGHFMLNSCSAPAYPLIWQPQV